MESQHYPKKKNEKNRTHEAGNFFQIPTTPNICMFEATELTQQTNGAWRSRLVP